MALIFSDGISLEEEALRNSTTASYTEQDIQKHLALGVFLYESYQDFMHEWVNCGNDPNDGVGVWFSLDKTIINGVEWRYDLAQ